MNVFSRIVLIAAACAAVWLPAPGAEAADRPFAAASAPRGKDAVMTQAQLRDCLAQKDSLDQHNAAALKAKADVLALQAELERSAADNAAALATLDRTKKEDVDAFNEKIVARNAKVDDYQAKAAAYNSDVESIQAQQQSYSAQCGNRRYDDRDLADIKRSKK